VLVVVVASAGCFVDALQCTPCGLTQHASGSTVLALHRAPIICLHSENAAYAVRIYSGPAGACAGILTLSSDMCNSML
jgi:hypothetical protein